MRTSILGIAALTLSLTGCQAMMYGTADDFSKLTVGMSKTQVINTLGTPIRVSVDDTKGEETLVYRRMQEVTGMWPHRYDVVLKADKVVLYGEHLKD